MNSEKIKYIYGHMARKITSSEDEWKKYLTYASRFFKYSFDKTLLAYAQNPNVTMLATPEIWNRVGRHRNYGVRGIAVCDFTDPDEKIEYLFDVKQTHGQRPPQQWRLTPALKSKLFSVLKPQGAEKVDDNAFEAAVLHRTQKAVDSRMDDCMDAFYLAFPDASELGQPEESLRAQLRGLLADSSGYMVCRRCGLSDTKGQGEDHFKNIAQFGSINAAAFLGDAVTEISHDVLMEIERAVRNIQKERGNQNGERVEFGIHGERRDFVSGSRGERTEAAWQVRPDAVEVSGGEQTQLGDALAYGRNPSQPDGESGRGGERNARPASAADVGEEPGSADGGYSGADAAPQFHSGHGGGSRPENADLQQLSFFGQQPSIMAEDEKSSAIYVAPEDVAAVLRHGSLTEEGKLRETLEDQERHPEKASVHDTDGTFPATTDVKNDYRYSEGDRLYEGGPKAKFRNNLEAVRLLKRIEAEGRMATGQEQKILANYVGWGGLSKSFDPKATDWQRGYEELRGLLTEQEYTQARASTTTAYYTEPAVIRQIYGALEQFGFHGGRILDPAMGTGNFFACLPADMAGSQLVGVELDSLTGRLARQLQQTARVQIKGFEETKFADNSFDAAVGNVPFSDYKVHDPRYDARHFLIHDYFIAKTLDLVKPGGLVAFITSKGTLDKQDSAVRRYIAERAELIGAVRLPNTAFKALAGTEVTTDILFLQKCEQLSDEVPAWTETVEQKDPENGASLRVNRYFAEHPEMMLGTMRVDSGMYGIDSVTELRPFPGHDLSADLAAAIENLHATYNPTPAKYSENEPARAGEARGLDDVDVESIRNFTYTVIDGGLYYRENGQLLPQAEKGVRAERIKGMHGVREALRRVIDIQLQPYAPETLQTAQRTLNKSYDLFTARYGALNDKANVAAFRDDDDLPLLQSIEDYDRETENYRKSPVFDRATIRAYRTPDRADTVEDGLLISLNVKLGVDIRYIGELTGKEPADVINELGGRIYLNPENYRESGILDGWELDEEYLSGDVKEKLAVAETQAKTYPDLFSRNVEALKAAQPTPLKASEIDFRIGAPWIPIEYYRQFMYETFGTLPYNRKADGIDIHYFSKNTEWFISNKRSEAQSVKVNQTYGSSRANAYMIFQDSLNLKTTTIRDPKPYIDDQGNDRVKYEVNVKQTLIARAKQQLIREKFQSWLFADRDRADALVKLYNDKFNNLRPREYDGSHLVFRNMAQDYELRPHQKDAVARILYSGTALLAHEVGAGKTAAMIAAGMTMRQCGAVRKPVYVVPNSLVEQWEHEFLRFYPTAHLLVAEKRDFEKQNRRQFFGKIASGDYDGIIIPQSSFEKIPISAERQMESIQTEIGGIEEMIQEAKDEKCERWTVKQMEVQRKQLQERYKRLSGEQKKDTVLNFEQLGIDFMFVDEAQAYKNYFTYTKMTNVAGIGKSSSQRALDMMMKCQYLQELNHGRGVVFATGTPISNSMSEMFVMQKYLQPDKLRELGLDMFDSWAATFGEVVTAMEITPEGTGFRNKTRFAKFHDLPELMSIFRLVADIRTADMLDLPTPKIAGEKPEVVATEATPYQKEMIQLFAERAEAIRGGSIDPSEDNMLKLTLDAKLLSIDPRLLDPNAPNDPDSKLNRCIADVHQIWEDTAADRLTQVIFCDVGVPSSDGRFDVYHEIKRQLLTCGVPETEVAFVHDAKTDAQREDLFERVRGGDVRIILGSTQKLGTGTNMQTRLYAAHHLDCPYRPSDIIQRNGRILRQGNNNPEVRIRNYVTKGTFDSYLWQIQEQKLRYISQIMTGKSITRSCEDVDETVLTAAEVKAIATANPDVAKKMEADNEVMRLKLLKSNWENERLSLQRDITGKYPQAIQHGMKWIGWIKEDIARADAHKQKDFSITVKGTVYEKRADAGEKLLEIAKHLGNQSGDCIKDVGEYRGFRIGLQRDAFQTAQFTLTGSIQYAMDMGDNSEGCTIRLDHLLERLPASLLETQRQLDNDKQQLEEAKSSAARPFEYEDQLTAQLALQAELDTKLEFGKSRLESSLADDSGDSPEEITETETEENDMSSKMEIRKPYESTEAYQLAAVIKTGDDEKRVEQLLQTGKIDVQQVQDGTTFLHAAVENGRYRSAKKLLEFGAFPDALDAQKTPALYAAVTKNNTEMAQLLLDHGANPDLTVKGAQLADYSPTPQMDRLLEDYIRVCNYSQRVNSRRH